jgi:hypothetical protein
MTGAIGLGGTQAQIDELHRGFDFGSSRTGRARRESVRPLNSSSFAAPRRQELFSASTGGFPNVRGRRLMRNLLAAKASIVLRDGPIRFMGHFRGRNHPREIHRHQNRAHHRCPTVAFAGLVAASEADSSALIGSDFVPALAIAALATVAVSFLGRALWDRIRLRFVLALGADVLGLAACVGLWRWLWLLLLSSTEGPNR